MAPSVLAGALRHEISWACKLGAVFVAAANLFTPSLGHSQTLYSHGDPTGDEQYFLERLNAARANPTAGGQSLAAETDPFILSNYSHYGINSSALAATFAAITPKPPLAFNADLIAAARAHAQDTAAMNAGSHIGSDGSTPPSRVTAAGYTNGFGGEVLVPNFPDVESIYAFLQVDWGVPSLIHRDILMELYAGAGTADYSSNIEIGVGINPVSSTDLNMTADFGYAGLPYYPQQPALLLGVVYVDGNHNGRYDPGEGVAGINVTMDGGQYYTVTSSSGGYALPLSTANGQPVDGPVTVHITGLPQGDLTSTFTVSQTPFLDTNFGSTYRVNIKWDSVVPAFLAGSARLPPSQDGWNYSSFFGYYNTLEFPFLYHISLGFLYFIDANDAQGGAYLYDLNGLGFMYTSPALFPYLYDFNAGAFYYYFTNTMAPAVFVNLSTGQYLSTP